MVISKRYEYLYHFLVFFRVHLRTRSSIAPVQTPRYCRLIRDSFSSKESSGQEQETAKTVSETYTRACTSTTMGKDVRIEIVQLHHFKS